MRPLTNDDKRTIRRAAIAIAIYLALFCGFKAWKFFQTKRTDYNQLIASAADFRHQVEPYKDKVLVVKRMMDDFHLDPAKLSRETIVGEASSAIQKAAAASGIQVGAVRETAAHTSGKEMASVQFEGSGPVPAVTGLLNRMQMLGYPLIIDSVQITPDNRPGNVKLALTIVILDFDQWKTTEAPHA